jgi:glutamate--cysteine ligase
MVPHFITAYNSPLLSIEKTMLDNIPSIEHWFRTQWHEHTPPFYCSVDIRNSGIKIAPVDTNLFPGGFNNLIPQMMDIATQAMMGVIEKMCPEAKNLLLIPENHTRNVFYSQNIATLVRILSNTGLHVRLGTLNPEITIPTEIISLDGTKLLLEPIKRIGFENKRIGLDGFDPCAILLNNDLSAGIPDILNNLHEQTLMPPIHAGWFMRKKSQHFCAYNVISSKFADLIGIDNWLINPYFANCDQIRFHEKIGLDCLQSNVQAVLNKTKQKYKEYGITDIPYAVVKADAGTYGMGIMMVNDASELADINRKTRNKMSVIKDGMEVSDVIIQEGVHTVERINNGVAEPVVYMMDRYIVGSFYRTHANKGINENLNAVGMNFVPMEYAQQPMLDAQNTSFDKLNRFYMYGVVARLALLSSALELECTEPVQNK